MKKIPFDIKYRPEIESGKYKVVTRDGRDVRIICWDKRVYGGRHEIVALVPTPEGSTESCQMYNPDGTLISATWNDNFRLFILTDEPELTEFEEAVGKMLFIRLSNDELIRETKEKSAKLLDIARKEILKDMPKWERCSAIRVGPNRYYVADDSTYKYLYDSFDGKRIIISDLEKLLKED